MLDVTIDTSRLKHDIRDLIAKCTRLKRPLRARWARPMAEEQRRLAKLRRRLTELFVLLALSRRRLHVLRPPRELRDAAGPSFDPAAWDAAAHAAEVAERVIGEYRPTASDQDRPEAAS